MDEQELQEMVMRHDAAIRKLAEIAKGSAKTARSLAERQETLSEALLTIAGDLHDGIDALLRVIEKLDLASDADRADLHKLQEQFVAIRDMFERKLAGVEKMSPPQLSVIEGGDDES
jgi:molecular chaperone GrpE (heat shock protein)